MGFGMRSVPVLVEIGHLAGHKALNAHAGRVGDGDVLLVEHGTAEDVVLAAEHRAFELVRIEARRYGVPVVGSEIIGLVPMEALIDTASYYLGLEDFSMNQVLEARIME